MKSTPTRRVLIAAAAVAALAIPLAACSGGGGGSSDGKTEITYLTQSDDANTTPAKALIEAFEKANPDITVKLDTQPAGTEGDNLMKTKLSTGSMDDVFHYNSGSLLQALNPDQTLVDLSDQSWVEHAHRRLQGGRLDRQGSVRRTVGHVVRRCRALQQEGLRRARSRRSHHVGRVHREQREDQVRRWRGRPDPAVLRRHLDEPAVRARRLRQRLGAGPAVGRAVHRQRPEREVHRRSPRSPASTTAQRCSRRAC